MLNQKQKDALVASRLAILASNNFIEINEAKIVDSIFRELDELLELSLTEVCLKRFEFFKIPETSPDYFSERVISLNDSEFIIAGIRFRGLDVNQPFVSVIPSKADLKENDLDQICNLVRKEFASFNPRYVQMTSSPKSSLGKNRGSVDRYTVVGDMSMMLGNPIDGSNAVIELQAPEQIDFYDLYLQEYEIFHHQTPSLKLEVRAESLEDLKQSMSDGLLFKILINGTVAGVIAGLDRDYHGLNGVSILEEILFHQFRGRGHGVHIQRAFSNRIKAKANLLWGTISHMNEPSLRTALKNGRQITEVDYFFPLTQGTL